MVVIFADFRLFSRQKLVSLERSLPTERHNHIVEGDAASYSFEYGNYHQIPYRTEDLTLECLDDGLPFYYNFRD